MHTPASNPRAVIFDFDGTLADSYAAIAASVNHVRAMHGMPPLPLEDVTRYVGRGAIYLLEHTVGTGYLEVDLARYKEHHPTVMVSLTRLLPGAADALAVLRRGGRRTGICSNKPRDFTVKLLDALGIAQDVEAVVGPEDAPRPKPAPEMLRVAMARLGVQPDEVLYVGDMVVDIETARAAGTAVWSVPTGSETRAALEEAKPDRLLSDLRELAAWFGAQAR
jgi:2-phosphoglycolate phosphatase